MIPTADDLASRPDVKAIRDMLLNHGGTEIDVPGEWLRDEDCLWRVWMRPVLDRGCLMGDRVEEHFMAKQDCHKNSATLFLEGQVDAFVTGFGLHPNGIWYFHSWGIRNENGEVVIETVGELFDKYVGPTYTGNEGTERVKGLLSTVTMGGF
jgi:hypothetical protein